MPSLTTYKNLNVYSNAAEDEATSFYNYRISQSGPSNSNMTIIDGALHDHDLSITSLNLTRGAIPVSATFVSTGYYEATQALIATLYSGLLINLKLSQTSAGTTTLKINALTTVSLMKINDAGNAVNITGDELVLNRYYTFYYDGSQFVWVDATAFDTINTGYQLCNGRLTLTSGTPITTADVTAATAIYFTPYSGNKIGLWTGTNWKVFNLAEISIKITDIQTGSLTNGNAVVTGLTDTSQMIVGMEVTGTGIQSATTILSIDSGTQITLNKTATSTSSQSLTFKVAAGKNLDIFCYSNAGTPKLEMTVWSSDTVRTTALVYQDGVYVKTGTLTRRFVGTVRVGTTAGQTEDSLLRRFVWNKNNRVPRMLKVTDATASWTYTTGSTRPWNFDGVATANRVQFVCGLAEDPISLFFSSSAAAASGSYPSLSIGEDSTSSPAANMVFSNAGNATGIFPLSAQYKNYLLGFHFLQLLELGGTGVTIYGGVNRGGIGEIIG